MNLEDNVLLAQKDDSMRNDIIQEYKLFITYCAKKTVGRFVTDQDDELSIAMIAFNEAITKYDRAKGPFLNFASITIKNRLIDFMRKEYKGTKSVPFSELSQEGNDGEEVAFDVEDTKSDNGDMKLELEALTDELKQYKISFFDLPKATPKSKKTKSACYSIIQFIIRNPVLINEIKLSNMLPIKTILGEIKINRKIIERHRNYIITAVVVLAGEYEMLSEYFKGVKEV